MASLTLYRFWMSMSVVAVAVAVLIPLDRDLMQWPWSLAWYFMAGGAIVSVLIAFWFRTKKDTLFDPSKEAWSWRKIVGVQLATFVVGSLALYGLFVVLREIV